MTDLSPEDLPDVLARPSPETSLQELFDMDPLKLSDIDLTRIITELRIDRQRYMDTGTKTVQAKKVVGKTKEVDKAAVDLLKDLGIEL